MDCGICQETIVLHENIKTECNHSYHMKCIASWIIRTDTCPMCRNKNPCGKNTFYYTICLYEFGINLEDFVYDPSRGSRIIRRGRTKINDFGFFPVLWKIDQSDVETLPLPDDENRMDDFEELPPTQPHLPHNESEYDSYDDGNMSEDLLNNEIDHEIESYRTNRI
jgi:hypothetical protein